MIIKLTYNNIKWLKEYMKSENTKYKDRFRKRKTEKNLNLMNNSKKAINIINAMTKQEKSRFNKHGFQALLADINSCEKNPQDYYRYETFNERISIIKTKTINYGVINKRLDKQYFSILHEKLDTNKYKNKWNREVFENLEECIKEWKNCIYKKIAEEKGVFTYE